MNLHDEMLEIRALGGFVLFKPTRDGVEIHVLILAGPADTKLKRLVRRKQAQVYCDRLLDCDNSEVQQYLNSCR